MRRALWPAPWGYWLSQFVRLGTDGLTLDDLDWAREHARRFVRSEGPLPTLRVGRQPYGLLPVTSLGLNHAVTSKRISTGIPRLDTMLGGEGYYRGSTVLISGTAGTGKSSFSAKFVEAACKRGERCLYFSFEESPSQITRNMASIGIDLATPVKKGRLRFHASRPTLYGLESHLVTFHNLIK